MRYFRRLLKTCLIFVYAVRIFLGNPILEVCEPLIINVYHIIKNRDKKTSAQVRPWSTKPCAHNTT